MANAMHDRNNSPYFRNEFLSDLFVTDRIEIFIVCVGQFWMFESLCNHLQPTSHLRKIRLLFYFSVLTTLPWKKKIIKRFTNFCIDKKMSAKSITNLVFAFLKMINTTKVCVCEYFPFLFNKIPRKCGDFTKDKFK